MEQNNAQRYRAIAERLRRESASVTTESVRLELLNLAGSYDRLADSLLGGVLPLEGERSSKRVQAASGDDVSVT